MKGKGKRAGLRRADHPDSSGSSLFYVGRCKLLLLLILSCVSASCERV